MRAFCENLMNMVLLFPVSSLNPQLVLGFYCSILRDFNLLVLTLHIAELVGDDPVQGVRHIHLDRLDGLVALDPRAEDQVHDHGVVPSELNRHVLMVPHEAILPEPQ